MTGKPPARIRRARLADLDALVALEVEAFSADRVSRAQYRRHLVSASARVLVAIQGSQLAGAALVLFRRGSQVARLYSLATANRSRGSGIGAALMGAAEAAALERGCRSMRLEVRVDNRAAIALYVRAGYDVIGRYAGYYADGSDALRCGKALREAP